MAKKADQKKAVERRYKGETQFNHDLIKLEMTIVERNMSFNPKRPRYVPVEHCHFFHTFDSNGKPQRHCNRVNGHFHEVFWDEDTLTAKCGPALCHKIEDGEMVTRPMVKQHTHDCTYLESELMTARKINTEAQMNISKQNDYRTIGLSHSSEQA